MIRRQHRRRLRQSADECDILSILEALADWIRKHM